MITDRSISPAIKPIGKPELTPPRKISLDNGLPVYYLISGSLDICKIDFIFHAGAWQQQSPLQSGLTNAMLQEGSEQYPAVRIAEQFDFHGAYLQLSADQHFGTISVIGLTRHFPALLPVLEDLIKRSVFPEHEFATLVTRRRQRFLLENEKVKVLSQKKFSEVLFGDSHPYAQTLKEADYGKITREDLIGFYRSFYHAGNCEIMISGRFDEGLIRLLNDCFGGNDWNGMPVQNPVPAIRSSPERKVLVAKPEAIQSAIRTGRLMVKKNHPDYLPLQVLVTILGGYFSSRLMNNIREDKGYTYGIGAHLFSLREAGYLVIATEVDKSYEQATLDEIMLELRRLRTDPVGKDELERVRQYLLGEFLREFDGPFALVQTFLNVHEFDLDYDFYEQYYRTLLSVTPEQLMCLAEKYFKEEEFYTVVAGRESL
ncbi:MAG: M16 family metallopeptidase [Mangrovibacterium sp.]